MRFRTLASLACLAAMLGGCGTVDFSTLQPAALSGSLFVMWVGEGDASGDGNFLFVPDPKDPLIFRRADPHQHGAVIQPGLMYTDGGSIPKIAQVFNGLSPWGYAPAYMIHDWIFTAHHCIVDSNDNARYDQVRDVTFDDSASILGEAIRGLVQSHQVKPNDVAERRLRRPSTAALRKISGTRTTPAPDCRYRHRTSRGPRLQFRGRPMQLR